MKLLKDSLKIEKYAIHQNSNSINRRPGSHIHKNISQLVLAAVLAAFKKFNLTSNTQGRVKGLFGGRHSCVLNTFWQNIFLFEQVSVKSCSWQREQSVCWSQFYRSAINADISDIYITLTSESRRHQCNVKNTNNPSFNKIERNWEYLLK